MLTLDLLTLLAGLAWFVFKFFSPTFPLDQTTVLALMVAILAAFRVYPQVRAMFRRGARLGLTWNDLWHSAAFWVLVAAVVAYLFHYFLPTFPLDGPAIAALLFWVLRTLFGIDPALARAGAAPKKK